MDNEQTNRPTIRWLDGLCAAAVAVLGLQIAFPKVSHSLLSAAQQLFWTLDFRNWTQSGWIAANCLVILLLIGIRFGPDLAAEWHQWRQRVDDERTRAESARRLKNQREMLERIERSRSRRIY